MRISERKRRLRDASSRPVQHVQQPVTPREHPAKGESTRAQQSARGKSRGAGKTSSAPARPVRMRGPRFYGGFGALGLVLSALLAWSTYSSYQAAVDKYHKALAAYPKQLATYREALARYQADHSHHVAKPILPPQPHAPVLSVMDFLLPILYAALSLAYLYLAYRASIRRTRATT
jgi:hypothetical protein